MDFVNLRRWFIWALNGDSIAVTKNVVLNENVKTEIYKC